MSWARLPLQGLPMWSLCENRSWLLGRSIVRPIGLSTANRLTATIHLMQEKTFQ